MLAISSHGQFWRSWLASTEDKTHLEDRETEMEGKLGESRTFILFYIFGADFIPFTNSDIYGFVLTINATIPFHLLSNNILTL